MDAHTQVEELKEVAAKLAIQIEYSDLSDNEFLFESGHCKLRGQDLIILDHRHSREEQVEIILNALKKFDLEDIFVPSWVRERLENLTTENIRP
ncbi:MAG: hypothetical protein V3U37_03315 [Nitrospinaceae bacterium]